MNAKTTGLRPSQPTEPAGVGQSSAILRNAGSNAWYARAELFGNKIEDERTREVYRDAVDHFFWDHPGIPG